MVNIDARTKVAKNIIRLAALEWDVDVSITTATVWAGGLLQQIELAHKTWKSEKAWAGKWDRKMGTDYLDEYEDEWDADHIIRSFINQKLGKAAYFDERDQFIPAEYVTKHGKAYLGA